MNEWTKEPWETKEGTLEITSTNQDKTKWIADCWEDEMSGIGEREAFSNAHRIVACVNACKGIPTECLGDEEWTTLMTGRKECEALRDERDEWEAKAVQHSFELGVAKRESSRARKDLDNMKRQCEALKANLELAKCKNDALRASLRDMVEYANGYAFHFEDVYGTKHQDDLSKMRDDIAKARGLLG